MVIYLKDAISSPLLYQGIVKLSQTNIELITEANNINQVRIVPKLDHYVIEIVYTVSEPDKFDGQYLAGVDLGLNNLVAITSNHPGIRPLLISGKRSWVIDGV